MPNAQFDLGRFYECGDGVLQDLAEAARLYRLAAAQGHAGARRSLGWLYHEGKGVAQAFAEAARMWRLAAAQGDADSQCHLGAGGGAGSCRRAVQPRLPLWRGEGRGARLCGSCAAVAAAQGDACSQCNLANLYQDGEGVTQNSVEAARLYRLAAAQGHGFAQYNLGVLHAEGEGVAQDTVEAARLYRLAAAQGHAAAQCNLGVSYARAGQCPCVRRALGSAERARVRLRLLHGLRRNAQAQDVRQVQSGAFCGAECARQAWPEHKPHCKRWEEQAAGKPEVMSHSSQ
jgi:hypothetical protein